jgi:hypothetical protein
MRILSASVFLFATAVAALAAGQHKPGDVPVDFTAKVNIDGSVGTAATSLTVHIASYTDDRDRTALLAALRRNGYQAFLPAFRKVPIVGYVQIRDKKWNLRWAQQQPLGQGQLITAATDEPIYFIGGGNVDAKPRAGFELAVIRLELGAAGSGTGTFAPAARVKPNKDVTSVEVRDYAGEPVKITSVTRSFP